MLRKKEPRWGYARPQTNLCSGRHLPRTGSTNSQTDRDGTNRIVLQMGVALGGSGLTMPKHLADEIELRRSRQAAHRTLPRRRQEFLSHAAGGPSSLSMVATW